MSLSTTPSLTGSDFFTGDSKTLPEIRSIRSTKLLPSLGIYCSLLYQLLELNVFCILPSIPDDPEDKVSLEDEDDPELGLLVELLGKGYKMKSEDWTKRTLDVGAVIEEFAMIQCHSMRIEDFSKLCDQDS
ncbi:unnamed protein product [Arabidopsis lyrata]|nr:unnamed protein product [Arabidopsis lyrata]